VADLLERVLDKGVVIAGDIKVSLLDIELLTIQIRLVVCSIDKAKEMGMDWWANTPVFMGPQHQPAETSESEDREKALEARVRELEARLEAAAPPDALPAAQSPAAEPPPAEPLTVQPRFRRREDAT
jgi:hypothetical protein